MAKDLFEDILKKALKASRKPVSTRKLASKTHMSWPTAKTKLTSLESRGIIKKGSLGKKTMWRLPSVSPKVFQIPKTTKRKKSKF